MMSHVTISAEAYRDVLRVKNIETMSAPFHGFLGADLGQYPPRKFESQDISAILRQIHHAL